MAEISYTYVATDDDLLVTWDLVTQADTFQPFHLNREFSALTLQVGGTFGGATIVAQGSNDNTTYAALTKIDNTAASVTVASVFNVQETPLYIKPTTSGGTAQSSKVVMLIRR